MSTEPASNLDTIYGIPELGTDEIVPIIDEDDEVEDESDEEEDSDKEVDNDSDTTEDSDSDRDEDDEETREKRISKPDESSGPAIPLFANLDNFDSDEDDEDEDDRDDQYLQKFDAEMKQQLITDYHPELRSHNYDEVDILSRVVRDETGVIIDPLHRTLPFLTRYEKARILGERAKQINSGGKPFIEVEASVLDGYLIALKELEQRKIPFIIQRPLPNGGLEMWKCSDLEILG